jgi:ribosomal protein S27E
LVVGVWEDLIAHRTVACLACGEAMAPRYGAGHAPVGGRCKGCGTTIH